MAEILEASALKGMMINAESGICTVYTKKWKEVNGEVIDGTVAIHQEDFGFDLIKDLPEYAAFIVSANTAFENWKIEQDEKSRQAE